MAKIKRRNHDHNIVLFCGVQIGEHRFSEYVSPTDSGPTLYAYYGCGGKTVITKTLSQLKSMYDGEVHFYN